MYKLLEQLRALCDYFASLILLSGFALPMEACLLIALMLKLLKIEVLDMSSTGFSKVIP